MIKATSKGNELKWEIKHILYKAELRVEPAQGQKSGNLYPSVYQSISQSYMWYVW